MGWYDTNAMCMRSSCVYMGFLVVWLGKNCWSHINAIYVIWRANGFHICTTTSTLLGGQLQCYIGSRWCCRSLAKWQTVEKNLFNWYIATTSYKRLIVEAKWCMYASVKEPSFDSENDLAPGRRQAILWTNAGILLIGPLETNFSEIIIGIQQFSFK